ncbi:MAG: contact-dependent growth inhibition system immunity protein [Flavipsychrobacter sp.]
MGVKKKSEIFLQKTLEQLENSNWGDAPKESSNLVRTIHQLRKIKLSELNIGDVRILLGQQIGLQYLVPIAINILKTDPFVEASFYNGDLLNALLSIDHIFWLSNSSLLSEITELINFIEAKLAEPGFDNDLKRQITRIITLFKSK